MIDGLRFTLVSIKPCHGPHVWPNIYSPFTSLHRHHLRIAPSHHGVRRKLACNLLYFLVVVAEPAGVPRGPGARTRPSLNRHEYFRTTLRLSHGLDVLYTHTRTGRRWDQTTQVSDSSTSTRPPARGRRPRSKRGHRPRKRPASCGSRTHRLAAKGLPRRMPATAGGLARCHRRVSHRPHHRCDAGAQHGHFRAVVAAGFDDSRPPVRSTIPSFARSFTCGIASAITWRSSGWRRAAG